MSMIVKNNLAAQMVLGQLNKNQSKLEKELSKVSSGQKINSAKDDASGYAISEKMREQLRCLEQDNQNVQNGSSLFKIAEGAVNNIVEELRNLKELAINAANDTNTSADRVTIQKEFAQKMANINDIATMTNYNGKILLDGRYKKVDWDKLYKESILKLISDGTAYFSHNLNKNAPVVNDISIVTGTDPSLVVESSGGKIQFVHVDGKNVVAANAQLSDGSIYKTTWDYLELGRGTSIVFFAAIQGTKFVKNSTIGIEAYYKRYFPLLVYKESESVDSTANEEAIKLGTSNRWRYCFMPKVGEKELNVAYSDEYADLYGRDYLQNDIYLEGTYKCYLNPVFDDSANPIDGQFGYIYFNDDGTLNDKATQVGSVLAKDDDAIDYSIYAIDFSNLTNYSSETNFGYSHTDRGIDTRELIFTKKLSEGVEFNPLKIQHGTKANQAINFYLEDMHTKSLGTSDLLDSNGNFLLESDEDRYYALSYDKTKQAAWLDTITNAQNKTLDDISVTTKQNANIAIRVLTGAIEYALDAATRIGAYLQRLEYTESNIVTMSENVQSAESTIRDADMAKAMTDYTKYNVITQAAQSMLAQANQSSSQVLSLLQ